MLAVSRRRTDAQDLLDGLPRFDFTPDDIDLPVETPKGGDDLQPDAIRMGCCFHFPPGVSCGRRQSVFAAEGVGFGDNQFFSLEAKWQAPFADKLKRNSKFRKRRVNSLLIVRSVRQMRALEKFDGRRWTKPSRRRASAAGESLGLMER